MFYTSYGKFMHKLIEEYYKKEITKEQALLRFYRDFSKEVRGKRPQESTVQKYIKAGAKYFREFQPFNYDMVDIEKKVEFSIGGYNFVGYIDYIGIKNDNYYIIDNKSRELKPRSNRAKPTLKDKELDLMLRQLYLYSAAIKQEYGEFPKALCFNCFRAGVFIEEPFDIKEYEKTIEWAVKLIEEIKEVDDFYPTADYFFCNNICQYGSTCFYNGR